MRLRMGVRRVLCCESLSQHNTRRTPIRRLPEDDLMIETCWSDFKCFSVKFYISALVGVIKVILELVYSHSDLHVPSDHVTIFMDIKYKGYIH